MRVAFTSYPPGQHEVTSWYDLPQVPQVGDSVSYGGDDNPIREVTHVRWVMEHGVWQAELDVK
jgi:aromatic ring-opening dioxygenase catalytic subunit (LigB family)